MLPAPREDCERRRKTGDPGYQRQASGRGIKAAPTLIKPNIDEIRMLTGKHCDDIQDIIDAAKTIHANGVEIVAVSLGADGSLVCW